MESKSRALGDRLDVLNCGNGPLGCLPVVSLRGMTTADSESWLLLELPSSTSTRRLLLSQTACKVIDTFGGSYCTWMLSSLPSVHPVTPGTPDTRKNNDLELLLQLFTNVFLHTETVHWQQRLTLREHFNSINRSEVLKQLATPAFSFKIALLLN